MTTTRCFIKAMLRFMGLWFSEAGHRAQGTGHWESYSLNGNGYPQSLRATAAFRCVRR
jgi:hypothetical protein